MSKTAIAAFEKWRQRNAPSAVLGRAADLQEAYMAGRRDLLKAQTVKRQHEARKARLTKPE
jgi:hypothetical protein